MARTTNGTSDNIDYGALSVLNSATAITIAGWIYRSAAGTTSTAGACADGSNRLLVQAWSDNNIYFSVGAASNSYGYCASSASGWNHYALVYNGGGATNALKCIGYLNGVAQTLTFVGTVSTALGTSWPWRFGKDLNPGNRFAAGGYAEWGVWAGLLSAADIATLADAVAPSLVRPDILSHYFPVTGRHSPEIDRFSTTAGTVTGTTTVAHPPMRYPSRVQAWKYGAAAVLSSVGHRIIGGGWGGRVIGA